MGDLRGKINSRVAALLARARALNQFVLAGIYVPLYAVCCWVEFFFRPDTDFIYKGLSLVLLIKLLFFPIPAFLSAVAIFFKRTTARILGLALSLPLTVLFGLFALTMIMDWIDILSKGYDPSLQRLHQYDLKKYEVVVYRVIPHMAFDAFSVLVRQEKELRYGIMKTRYIHFEHRSDSASCEILGDDKIKLIIAGKKDAMIFQLEPLVD